MSCMSGKYFIDTNIIVYSHDDAYPEKKEKAQALIFTGLREKSGVISAQVLSEFFVTITKKVEMPYSVPAARHELMLLSHLEIVELDHDLVIRAARLHETLTVSYWDGLILAAAERADCDVLYSEDLSHGQTYAGIRCMNPFLPGE
jgi:predicted nucleic acid-binding protein